MGLFAQQTCHSKKTGAANYFNDGSVVVTANTRTLKLFAAEGNSAIIHFIIYIHRSLVTPVQR